LHGDRHPSTLADMTDRLFPESELPPATQGVDEAPVRYQTVQRDQIELQPCDLEALLPPGHAARLVWRFVEGLDLSAFYATIRAREGHAGRAPIDPKILIALWLYATMDGVGSAREVDRLCTSQDAYRWLRGGVSVNYHTLSDFRVAHHAALDDLLTQSIAVLLQRDVITLARVAYDGTRVRGSAGTGSFRRAATLQDCLKRAQQQVTRTAKQTDAPVNARVEAAQRRAADERVARVEEALVQLPAVQATKARQRATRRTEARVSTTDPDARVMKMAHGAYLPAYNVQIATDVASRAIVGIAVTNVGSDRGSLPPMLTQVRTRTGRVPASALMDGGCFTRATITTAAAQGVTVYAPVSTRHGGPTAVPRRTDSVAVREWRARMSTAEAQQVYHQRAATAEWVHADARTHRALSPIPVRGLPKIHTWALWIALTHNMLRLMDIVPHLMT
jgi:transposase